MKILPKILLFLTVMALLFAFPVYVSAQEPPPDQTFTGDKLVLGDDYVLRDDQTLVGDLVVLGGNVEIEENATVNGNIALLGGNLDFSGTVSGTISVFGGNVNLHSGAVVRGNIDSFGGNIDGIDEARILGRVNTITPRAMFFNFDRFQDGFTPVWGIGAFLNEFLTNILRIIAVAILALVVALLMPKPVDRVARSITIQPLLSGGAGLLTLLVTPLALVILFITILLIPVALIAILGLAIALLFGWIAVGYELGQRLAVLFKTQWSEPISAGLGTLVLGTIIWLLGYVFCLGALVTILVASVGLGGIILSKFGTQVYSLQTGTPLSRAAPAVIPPAAPATQPDPAPSPTTEPPGQGEG